MERRLHGLATWAGAALLLLTGVAPRLCPAATEGLSLQPDPLRLALSLGLLALLIHPVQRLLLRPLADVLVQRSVRTEGALARAERDGAESQELAASIEQRLAAARAEGQSLRSSALAQAEASERELLARAREEAARTNESIRALLAAEAATAREALQSLARDLARESASRLLGRPL
jgi:F0F1-type ATP synthase membrane subunit b/b'